MKIINTRLTGGRHIELDVYDDERGYFLESYHAPRYAALTDKAGNTPPTFVQDNASYSRKGVLRGLHCQPRHPQGKLVHVSQGRIFDVAVDLRRQSPTFGQWEGIVLQGYDCVDGNSCSGNPYSPTQSPATLTQLWIPPGFAHGFVVLSDAAMVHYKCTDYYHPEDQACLRWDDPGLGIDWPVSNPVLSERDGRGNNLADLIDLMDGAE